MLDDPDGLWGSFPQSIKKLSNQRGASLGSQPQCIFEWEFPSRAANLWGQTEQTQQATTGDEGMRVLGHLRSKHGGDGIVWGLRVGPRRSPTSTSVPILPQLDLCSWPHPELWARMPKAGHKPHRVSHHQGQSTGQKLNSTVSSFLSACNPQLPSLRDPHPCSLSLSGPNALVALVLCHWPPNLWVYFSQCLLMLLHALHSGWQRLGSLGFHSLLIFLSPFYAFYKLQCSYL